MPSKILNKAVKNKKAAASDGKFWKPGSSEPPTTTTPTAQSKLPSAIDSTSASSSSKSPKPNLSKGVMSMKFMARKVEIADEERLEAKKRRKVLDSGWSNVDTSAVGQDDSMTSDDKIVCTVEKEDLYGALPGRRSFGGFNNVVERFYQNSMDTQKFGLSSEGIEDDNISNEEMMSRYSDLIGLPTGQKR